MAAQKDKGTYIIQGDPKQMVHKDSLLKSVLEVQFYFSAGVLEPENWPHLRQHTNFSTAI